MCYNIMDLITFITNEHFPHKSRVQDWLFFKYDLWVDNLGAAI